MFVKGQKKTGGRKKGSPNQAYTIKAILKGILDEERLTELWKGYLSHKDLEVRFEAFKLANFYLFGKPITIVAGAEDLPPVKIDISAIPKFHKPAK